MGMLALGPQMSVSNRAPELNAGFDLRVVLHVPINKMPSTYNS